MKATRQLRYVENEWTTHEHSGKFAAFKEIKMVTYNVLYPKAKGDVNSTIYDLTHPNIRYPYQFVMLQGLDADIIGLNEVTTEYYDAIVAQDWVRRDYFVCDSIDRKGNVFGNMLLSKYPFKSVHHLKVTTISRNCLVVDIPTSEDHSLIITCCHLKANIMNYSTRAKQMEQIYDCMDQMSKTNTKVVIGDLNFHMEMEDSNIRSDYVDVWKKVNPDLPGWSFDGYVNKMQHEMFPTAMISAQMRLDRILLSSSLLQPTNCKLFGSQPIFEQKVREEPYSPIDYVRSPIKALGGLFGFDLLVKEKEDYLFASDHFGILAEFTIKEDTNL
jgi:endonuclease/exonuclease/phosphatase family metal-dependent hydrolase